jgi:hypothetical protein
MELWDRPIFISEKYQMLLSLKLSVDSGSVVGVIARALGEDMVLCAVESINSMGDDVIVHFKECDLHGKKLRQSFIALQDISRIHPFITQYNDPIHERIRKMRAA